MRGTQAIGGRGGIRTHGRVAPTPDFESGAFNHSATLPSEAECLRYFGRRRKGIYLPKEQADSAAHNCSKFASRLSHFESGYALPFPRVELCKETCDWHIVCPFPRLKAKQDFNESRLSQRCSRFGEGYCALPPGFSLKRAYDGSVSKHEIKSLASNRRRRCLVLRTVLSGKDHRQWRDL